MNIRDIAKAAGVSVATVSKIMNHKDSEISDKTRQKVLEVIRAYQYTPYDNLKISMNNEQSRMIAFVYQVELFTQEALFLMEQTISGLGYSLVVYGLEEPAYRNLHRIMQVIASKKIEGILLGFTDLSLVESATELNYNHVPEALICASRSELCTTFHLDYSHIAEKVLPELLLLGHRRIGCLLADNYSAQTDAYREGFDKAGKKYSNYGLDECLMYIHTGKIETLVAQVERWLQLNITAFFCQSKFLAGIVYDILKERGYKIPYDVSVVCGEPAGAGDYFSPELASCSFSPEEIFPAAAQYLLKRIEMRSNPTARTHGFSPVFHKGGSIGPIKNSGKQILVVGNCSTDYTLQLEHLPEADEFLTTGGMTIIPGGKAVVQAVGAGKLGGSVYILGCVGNDVEGQNIIGALKNAAVHTEGLRVVSALPTGRAYILSVPKGQSTVISYPGANSVYMVEHMRPYSHLFQSSQFCLLSTELDERLIRYVVRCCEKYHTELFLKPSAMQQFPEELYAKAAYVVPNRTELNCLIPGDGTYEEKAEQLYRKGCKNVIVTLGKHGCYLRNEQYSMSIPAADFHHSDSTGAANCFIAALAVALSEDNPLLYAICCATYAAGISVTQPGVQTSFPDRKLLEIYLDDIQEMYRTLV